MAPTAMLSDGRRVPIWSMLSGMRLAEVARLVVISCHESPPCHATSPWSSVCAVGMPL